jgi:hypothetical protein
MEKHQGNAGDAAITLRSLEDTGLIYAGNASENLHIK